MVNYVTQEILFMLEQVRFEYLPLARERILSSSESELQRDLT